MKIGIDMMGGDYAPHQTTLGVLQSFSELPEDCKLVLIGDKNEILPIIKSNGGQESDFEFVHTTEVIGMGESATKSIFQKPNSSIAVGFNLLKEKKIDAFASAGNSGAMMVGAMFSVKAIQGVLRPTISSILPKEDGSMGLILDVGVNADCKPEHLQQFALLGSLFAEHVYHIKNPKVGLMNIGEEDEKGNILAKETNSLLKSSKEVNFIGNVEGRDLFNDKADVIVCDGFTGNVILKSAEAIFTIMRKRGINDPYFNRYDYENYGGTPILGINSTVMVAHGISNAKAIKNMILLSREVVEARLTEKIAAALPEVIAG